MDLKSLIEGAYKGKPGGSAGEALAGKSSAEKGGSASVGKGRTAASGKAGSPPRPQVDGEAEGLIKKVAADRGYRKVAKFLILLGQEEAARVMRHLKPDELEGVVREIATIKSIEKVEAEAIMEEFRSLIARGAGSPRGGSDTAKEILEAAFGAERGQAILEKALPGTARPFSMLEGLDATQILILMKDESSHVLAIVLPYLEPKLASEVLVRLPEAQRTETVKRMAKLEKISPEVIAGIEDGLRKRLISMGRVEDSSVDGVSALAGILRFVDSDLEEGILDALEEERPELTESIREQLFTLEDVQRVRRQDLAAELRDRTDRDLALLLKGKSEGFKEKILSAVSRDRRRLILDEYDYLGSVKRADADAATRDFLSRLKRLHESGDLVLEDEDDLVE
jgi:flagellar motor switch protein FliG